MSRRFPAFAFPLLSVILFASAPAAAQTTPEQIGKYVVDVRGSLAKYGENPQLASNLSVPPTNLPSRGLGFEVGAHFFPLRYRAVTFGIGGSFHASRGEERPATVAGQTGPGGPAVRSTLRALSPQLSFNFGTRDGWSYISGGIATSTFTQEKLPAPAATPPVAAGAPRLSSKTINYGGGGRWFMKDRLAFTFDVRFYAINPIVATPSQPITTPRMTLLVVSVGASFR